MADVLKQTLFFNGSPDLTVNDLSGAGAGVSRSITAAESHDASDATYAGLTVNDSTLDSLDGDATLDITKALGTASVSGAISFVRMKARARDVRTGGAGTVSGSWQPEINGTLRGSVAGVSASFTDYQQDFTTDPADSAAWTNAKLNAQTFGVQLHSFHTDLAFLTTSEARLSEFSLEVWGPDVVVETPATVHATAGVGAASGISGLVVATPATVSATAGVPAATNVPGAVVQVCETVSVSAGVDELGTSLAKVGFDPTTVTPLATFVDGGNVPVTVRSNTSPYFDQKLSTKVLQSAVGPQTVTRTYNYGGIAQTGVTGSGIITGIRCFAIVRPAKNSGTINNFRIRGVAVETQPTVYALPVTSAMWQTIGTPLITGSFDWDTLWTALVGWSLQADLSVTVPGDVAQVEVAEAWIEVHGPVGSPPDTIELVHPLGDIQIVQGLRTTILP